MLLLRLAVHSGVFGIAPHTGMPFADFGQLELGMQGVEHGCPFLGVCVVGGWTGATARRSSGGDVRRNGRTRARGSGATELSSGRQAVRVPPRGASMVCVSCCGVIFIVGLLSR
jgi:hypothetical protein